MRWYAFIAVAALCALCASCAGVRGTMSVSSSVHDTLYVMRARVDSVVRRDSVFCEVKGDTVFVDRTHVLYRYVSLTDTVRIARTDTVVREVPVREPRRTSVSDRVADALSLAAIIALAVVLAAIARRMRG